MPTPNIASIRLAAFLCALQKFLISITADSNVCLRAFGLVDYFFDISILKERKKLGGIFLYFSNFGLYIFAISNSLILLIGIYEIFEFNVVDASIV